MAIVRNVLLTPFPKLRGPRSARRASPAERLLLEAFVVPCAPKGKRNTVIIKQLDPSRTITPASVVRLVIGPTAIKKVAKFVPEDSIPIKPKRKVAKFVKQVVTIRIRRVLT